MRYTVSKNITTGIIILAESALISVVSGVDFLTITGVILPFVVGTKMIHHFIENRHTSVIE